MHSASGSTSTGQSSLSVPSSSSSRQPTPTRTERTETIKPTLPPRGIPNPSQTLTQANYNAQSYTSQRSTSSGSESNAPHGLRAQLHHLLPKHALFHVRVQIHQLASVPLVKGEFGARWKFRKVKSRKEHKGKEKATHDGHGQDDTDEEEGDDLDHQSVAVSDNSSHTGHDHLGVPSLVVSDGNNHSPPSSSRPSSPSPYAQYLSSEWLPQSFLSNNHSRTHLPHSDTTKPQSKSLSSTTPPNGYAPAKGMTPYLKLHEHSVFWEQTLNVVVQMDVNRDTMDLLPNELKLVIMQRVIPGDIDAPHNPRLGAVYLNLAEYANVGPITRRYLLSQSKTNATLKLTIELEHVAGEKKYKPPPLPKGEILGGIAGILENDVYRTRPRAMDLYGMYSGPPTPARKSLSSRFGQNKTDPFDLSNLSSSYGPRTTETLIEAIFNPVASHSERPSPFTFFVPLEPQSNQPKLTSPLAKLAADSNNINSNVDQGGNGSIHGSLLAATGEGDESVHSAATSSDYDYAQSVRSGASHSMKAPTMSSRNSYSSHGHQGIEFGAGVLRMGVGAEEERKPWWKKITISRPGTPAGIVSG